MFDATRKKPPGVVRTNIVHCVQPLARQQLKRAMEKPETYRSGSH
jgi:hypothetical protein